MKLEEGILKWNNFFFINIYVIKLNQTKLYTFDFT